MNKIIAQISIFLLFASYSWAAAPLIYYTDIIAGPNSGGESNNGCYLTINGINFGSTQGDSTVTIGSGAVATYKTWSDTEISVQIGSSAADGDIVLTTSEGSSTGPEQFDVVTGDIYFISTSGNDSTGDGSYATPYRTANHVEQLAAFGAGDFLIVRGGTYDLSSGNENLSYSSWWNFSKNVAGSAAAVMTVQGYPGETVTVDWGTDETSGTRGMRCMREVDYFAVSNITFDLQDSGGVSLYFGFYNATDAYVNHSRLVNITVTGGMAGATYGVNTMSLQRTDYIKIYGLDIGNQSSIASSELESHMIYLSHFYTEADIGWCYIHDNAYGRAALQIAGDSWGGAPNWGNNDDVTIHHNRFVNLPEAAVLFNLGSVGPIYFYHNLINNVCSSDPAGFSPIAFRGAASDQETAAGVYHFFNNTVYTDAEDYNPGGILQFAYCVGGGYNWPEHVYLRNNIFRAITNTSNYYQNSCSALFSLVTNLTSSNNLWYGSTESTPSFASSGQATDPSFTTAGSDFTLQEGSPAINNGTSIAGYASLSFYNYDLQGQELSTSAPDIGSYQYDVGSETPAATIQCSGLFSGG